MTLGLFFTSWLNRSFSQRFRLNWLNNAPPASASWTSAPAGYVGGVGTVRPALGRGSLGGRLGRRPSWLCNSTIRLFVQWRVCRCPNPPLHFSVLNLAKILLNNSFYFIRRRQKIYKRCLIYFLRVQVSGKYNVI